MKALKVLIFSVSRCENYNSSTRRKRKPLKFFYNKNIRVETRNFAWGKEGTIGKNVTFDRTKMDFFSTVPFHNSF